MPIATIGLAKAGIRFADQSDDIRMAARHAVDDNGGSVEGYYESDIQVALPNSLDSRMAIKTAMADLGLFEAPDCRYRYPLGSDVNWAPAHLQHSGYWLYTRFRPA